MLELVIRHTNAQFHQNPSRNDNNTEFIKIDNHNAASMSAISKMSQHNQVSKDMSSSVHMQRFTKIH